MRRTISLQNGILLSSSFLLVFILAVYVNFRINRLLVRLEHGVVSSLERNFKIRISYDRLYLTGLNSLEVQGMRIHRSSFHDRATLIEIDRLRVTLNFLDLMFSTKEDEESLRLIEASGVVLNYYPAKKLPDGVELSGQIAEKLEGPSSNLEQKLILGIRVLDGWARIYSKPYDPYKNQSPLAQLQIQRGSFKMNRGRLRVDLKSRTGLVSRGFFSTRLDLSGDFGVDFQEGDLLLSLHDSILGGAGIPDIRFFISLRQGHLLVDSNPFRQAVSIKGSCSPEGDGGFQLRFNKESGFFVAFLKRYFPGDLDSMFIRPGVKYVPEGLFTVTLRQGSFNMRGGFQIRDPGGRKVLDLACRGNSRFLAVDRFSLKRFPRFISMRGIWRFADSLPELQGVLRRVKLNGQRVSGNVRIRQYASGRYRLSLGGVLLNGASLGTFSSLVAMHKSGIELDTSGMRQRLHVRGRISDLKNMDLRLQVTGYRFAVLARAFGATPFWPERIAQGRFSVLMEDGYFSSKGTVSAQHVAVADDRISVAYSFTGEELLLHRAALPGYGLYLSGAVKILADGFRVRMNGDHKGSRFHLNGGLQKQGEAYRLQLNMPGRLTVAGTLSDAGLYCRYRLKNLPLNSFGVDARAVGRGSFALRNGVVYSEGKISSKGPVMSGLGLDSLKIRYRLTDSELTLKKIVLDAKQRQQEGYGRLSFSGRAVRGSLNIGRALEAYLNYESGWFDSRLVFKGYQVSGIPGEDFSGELTGVVHATGPPASPRLACNLELKNGKLLGRELEGTLRSRQTDGGIQIEGGKIRFGDITLSLGKGRAVRSPGGYRLDQRVRASMGGIATVKTAFRAAGKWENSALDLYLDVSSFSVNKYQFGGTKTRLQYAQGRVNLIRRSAPGMSGFFDIQQNAFSLKLFDSNQLNLDMAGEFGHGRVDLYLNSDRFSLAAMKLLPGAFRKAGGTGKFQLHVQGPVEDVTVQGFFRVDAGSFQSTFLQETARKVVMDIRFLGNKIDIREVSASVGGETFLLNGYCYLRRNRVEDLNFRFATGRNKGLPVALDVTGFQLKGRVFADLFLRGDPGGPTLQGRVALRDADIYYMGGTSGSSSGSSSEGLAEGINWHVDFTALDGVNYVNPLVIAVIKPQSRIGFRNRMMDNNFRIKGRLDVVHGSLDYVSHQFSIETPTYLEFKRVGSGSDAWLNFKGKAVVKDEHQENINIYILFFGSLSGKLEPTFYSEPGKTDQEIKTLLGIQLASSGATSDKNSASFLYKSTDLLSSIGILQPLSKEIRQHVGLDLFTIRTSVVRYLLERESLNALDPRKQLSVWRDTQLTLGKYLTDFLFLEYTLMLRESIETPGELLPVHQVGVELSFNPFHFGYSLRQTQESWNSDYEQNVEIRFRKRF